MSKAERKMYPSVASLNLVRNAIDSAGKERNESVHERREAGSLAGSSANLLAFLVDLKLVAARAMVSLPVLTPGDRPN